MGLISRIREWNRRTNERWQSWGARQNERLEQGKQRSMAATERHRARHEETAQQLRENKEQSAAPRTGFSLPWWGRLAQVATFIFVALAVFSVTTIPIFVAVLGGAGLLGFEGGTVAGWITGILMLGLAVGVPLLAGRLAVHLIFKLALARHRSTTDNSRTWL